MHRQAQGLHERIDLLTAAELRRGQHLVLHRHFDRIERGQADRKKLAEDDPIVQSFGDAKLQFRCQTLQAHRYLARIVRLNGKTAVAHQHPIDDAVVDEATLAARFEHEIGIMRDKASMRAIVMHAREHVDVDEALVNGRNHRVGERMRKPHQVGIACRRIDHHEFVGMLDRRDCFGERGEFDRLVIAHIIGSAAIERVMQRQLDRPRRRLPRSGDFRENASASAGARRDRSRRRDTPLSGVRW
jgi:hypothetical protein